jgi:hypothetical protein
MKEEEELVGEQRGEEKGDRECYHQSSIHIKIGLHMINTVYKYENMKSIILYN